jgi:hypothetical protein
VYKSAEIIMTKNKRNVFYRHLPTKRSWLRSGGMAALLSLSMLQTACNEMTRPSNNVPVIAGKASLGVTVVAAGLIRGDGEHIGPVVNGLKVSRIDTGELVITFDSYRMPTAQFQYVINVLSVNSTARASLMSVYFIEYLPDGIRFNVRKDNANISAADLQTAQFMFVVSLIE